MKLLLSVRQDLEDVVAITSSGKKQTNHHRSAVTTVLNVNSFTAAKNACKKLCDDDTSCTAAETRQNQKRNKAKQIKRFCANDTLQISISHRNEPSRAKKRCVRSKAAS